MAHLYEASIWQGGSGLWYCADIKELGLGSSRWWVPCRILGISPENYVELLVKEFKVSQISFNEEKNFLHFCWRKEADCRKYKNWINKEARKHNYVY